MQVSSGWKNGRLQLKTGFGLALILLAALLEWPLISDDRYILGFVLLTAAVVACLWILWRWGMFSLVLVLLCWLPFQNGVVALLYDAGIVNTLTSGILILLKEIAIIGLVGLAIISGRIRKWLWVDLWFALYVIWILLHLPFGGLSMSIKVAGVRMLIIPVILYFLGRTIPIPINGLKQMWRVLLAASLAVVILGWLEYTLVPSDLLWKWQMAMQMAKGQTVGAELTIANQLGGLFFTALVSPLDGSLIWVRRMTSSYLEPLALGYALVMPLVFIFYCAVSGRHSPLRPRWINVLLLIMIGLGQALAMSRGAILATLIGVAVIIVADRRIRTRAIAFVLIGITIAMVIPPVRVYILNTIGVEDPSSRGHLVEMQKGWQLLLQEPLGLGLGQGGYVGFQYANQEATGAGESYYFSLSSQVGIVGLALFGVGLIALALRMWRTYRMGATLWLKISALVTLAALTGYCLAAVTSEGALGFLTSGALWLMAGIVTQLGADKSHKSQHLLALPSQSEGRNVPH